MVLLRALLITLLLTTAAHAQSFGEFFKIEVAPGRDPVPVATPELSVLRRLTPKLPEAQGRVLAAKLALQAAMQHASAWGATGVLNAIQVPASRRGVFIDTPSFTIDVQPWRSGTEILKALLLSYELLGRSAWGWKEWISGAATVLGVVQVIGLGLVVNRQGVIRPRQ